MVEFTIRGADELRGGTGCGANELRGIRAEGRTGCGADELRGGRAAGRTGCGVDGLQGGRAAGRIGCGADKLQGGMSFGADGLRDRPVPRIKECWYQRLRDISAQVQSAKEIKKEESADCGIPTHAQNVWFLYL